jgi:hypothetical protein
MKRDLLSMAAMLVHTVFFWLKPGQDRAAFLDQVKTLAGIPTLKHCWVGTPASTDKRPVIDRSYDVGLTTVFASVADHDVYQEHPIHLAFLAANQDRWTKVQVYDAQ